MIPFLCGIHGKLNATHLKTEQKIKDVIFTQ